MVGHGGFLLDQEIAKEVDGVDVIVGGHSNTFLYTGEVFIWISYTHCPCWQIKINY